MNEARRQSCLAHMGVTLWYARAPLPGAAVSPDFDFSIDTGTGPAEPAAPSPVPARPRVESPVAPPQEHSRRQMKSVRASLGETEAPQPEAPGADKVPVAEAAAVERAPASHKHRIQCALWSGRYLNLAVDLSNDVSEEVQLTLAANISRALGDEPEQQHSITWPVFANPDVPGNDDEGLLRIGDRLLATMPDRPWLVMGEQSSDFLNLLRESSGREKRPVIWLVTTDSLQSLAADPTRKRALWEALQRQLAETPLTGG